MPSPRRPPRPRASDLAVRDKLRRAKRSPPPPPAPAAHGGLSRGLVMPVPDDRDATGTTALISDEDDIVVLEDAVEQRRRRAKSDAFAALTTPETAPLPLRAQCAPVQDHGNPLERTLDVGRLLTRERRAVLGENPVVSASKHRILSTMAIVALCFFTVCGGPAGSEPVTATGGPLLALIGFVVMPLVINLPITFVIAELCSAFPEDGGFAMWILNAFGPFWGFLEGYWAWVRSVFDRVVYVQVIYLYVFDTLGIVIQSSVLQYSIKALIAIGLALPSLLGVRLVTFLLSSMLAIVVVLFLVFTAWGITETHNTAQFLNIRLSTISFAGVENTHTDGSSSTEEDQRGGIATVTGSWDVDWVLYLNSLFWNFDGFYLASVFGGEVSNPARTYPRAFTISYIVMWLVYLLPMIAAVGANRPHWSTWEDYSYVDSIADQIGRSTLHAVVVVAVVVGGSGMYVAELFCEAYQISGMAECGLAPGVFQKRDSRFAMPRVSIAFSLFVVVIALAFDVSAIVDVGNAFSAIVELFIIAAAVKLRRTLPFIPRPTKIPGGTTGLCAVLTLPSLMLVFVLVKTLYEPTTVIVFTVVTAIGVVLGMWQRRQIQRQA